MLEHTFIHLPNLGPKKEHRLWSGGIKTWDDFLERFGSSAYHKDWCSRIASSDFALKDKDADFFAQAIPKSETWRCFPHFGKAVYLDIETTGLSPQGDHVTVIGLYDGSKTLSYIHGKNLDDFSKEIKKYEMVVTFNGSIFDIPFLRSHLEGLEIPSLHIDLRFLLSSLDVRGGLKKIEKRFGFEREDDLKGLTGYDAVLLWKAYKRGDEDALDKLVRYNAADIVNLKKLVKWAYEEKRKRTEFDAIP
jgi:uncharacterized protein YprB with RNaseH-like and TPR domain